MRLTYKANDSQNNNERQPISIPSPYGRGTITIGHVKGNGFYKSVNDNQILFRPKALCLDNGIIFQLQRLGVTKIVVRHKSKDLKWHLPLSLFLEKAFPINRGKAGMQKCVLIKSWYSNQSNQKQNKQLQLTFGGM